VNQGQFGRRIVRHCKSESTARATQHKPGDFPLVNNPLGSVCADRAAHLELGYLSDLLFSRWAA
jgi:hypothetical protein